jgi:hypothetical protein
MELPEDVLQIIREYSKPVTHPNWRNRQWICVGDLYKDILQQDINIAPTTTIFLYQQFMLNVHNNNCWWDLYVYKNKYGIAEMSKFYGINPKICDVIMNS